MRVNPRSRLPTKDSLSKRLPDEESRSVYKLYVKLLLAIVTVPIGLTLVLSGAVLIPMMAFVYNILGVIVSSSMVAGGLLLCAGAYLWLTAPA